ncbi:hypothetical protein FQR65_LT01493 [Abscondita terminalis]|nr:hypothetical protein FQR65_LT01493 [Abscondita terminalis]
MENDDNSSGPFKIRCSNIPDEFMKKTIARQHFEQFGEVVHAIIKPKSRMCYIHYKYYRNAQNALLNGSHYNGKKFNISIVKNVVKKRQSWKEDDPTWLPDSDIQNELQAMSAIGESRRTYNLRQEPMSVDAPVRQPHAIIKKNIKRNRNIDKVKLKNEWTTEELELLNVLKQPAHSIDDKYKVLEARDKLMRSRGKKHADLTKATATVGTCPDMCPEKERLLREIQHQVALYEQDINGRSMNQSLAIKQYSRSSADQEAPLPHELRPVSVLELSMGYLMHCIMDLCESEDVNLAEWFHFVWDRTRSIRKDITQQELCCQGSVALIEQCARFHIHCSARLVTEDPSVFDQKINTENLTKCLQTLKYMYHDLNLKGEDCKNEPEFRAYIILLNLNDGNFMSEVQQLKLEIQKSPEIKFALAIYSAIDKNNFVKFFKLVRSTNYLNACILLRYFTQIRARALTTIVKCYSPRNTYTQFSLMELQQLLAFEDVASAVEFITSYGLHLSQDQTQVMLDRKSYQEPELPVTQERATRVVESKRLQKVGEIVCGGSLLPPYFQNYVPHNSFNENGVLEIKGTLADILKDAQNQPKQEIVVEEEPESKPSSEDQIDSVKVDPSQPFWSLQKEPNKIFFKTKSDSPPRFGIFGSPNLKTTEPSKPFSFKPQASIFSEQPKTGFAQQLKPFGDKPSGSVFNKKVSEIVEHKQDIFSGKNTTFSVPQFPRETKQEDSLAQKFFADYKPKSEIAKPSATFGGFHFEPDPPKPEISVAPKVDEEQLKLEEEKKRRILKQKEEEEEKERKRREKLERERVEELKRKELEEKLRAEKAKQEQERLEIERNKKIANMAEKERLLTLEIKKSVEKLMDDLLKKVEEIRKKERLAEIALKMTNLKIKLFVQKWQQKCRFNKRKRHAIDQNPVWLPTRTLDEEASQLFTSNQAISLRNIKRYKCGKSCDIVVPKKPEVVKFNVERYYELVMQSYCKMRIRLPKEIFWKVTVSLPDFQEMKNGLNVIEELTTKYFGWKDRYGTTSIIDEYRQEKLFAYCVDKKQGELPVDDNTDAILFVAHEPNDLLYKRVTTSLNNFPENASVAVTVIFSNSNPNTINSQRLVQVLDADKHIINYKVVVTQDEKLINALSESLEFLSKNISQPPPLQLDSLQSYIHTNLITNLWKKLTSYAAWNTQYKMCLKIPNLVINLYNEGLERLKEVVMERNAREYSDFPTEFEKYLLDKTTDTLPCCYRYFPSFWKTDVYRSLVTDTILSLRLPQYRGIWPPTDESNLERSIFEYCSKISSDPRALFYKVMVAVLKNFDPSEDFEKIKNTLWIDIVEVVAAEKLDNTNFCLRHTEFHSKSNFTELFVVYKIGTLDNFKSSEWFYLEHPLIKNEIRRMNEKMKLQEKITQAKMIDITVDFDLDAIEKNLRGVKKSQEVLKNNEIEELESYIADLEESIEIHKRINASFQDTVKKALGID